MFLCSFFFRNVAFSRQLPEKLLQSTVLSSGIDTAHLCTSMNSIPLRQVLAEMDAGMHFSMAVVTADKRKKKGGEWIIYHHAVKHEKAAKKGLPHQVSIPVSGITRNPNHFENRTRNICLIPSGEIRTIHIRLIRRYNGKTVI